jgi:hypothetical protein
MACLMNIFARRSQQPVRIEPQLTASSAQQDPERAALTAAMAKDRARSMRRQVVANILLACALLAFLAAVVIR